MSVETRNKLKSAIASGTTVNIIKDDPWSKWLTMTVIAFFLSTGIGILSYTGVVSNVYNYFTTTHKTYVHTNFSLNDTWIEMQIDGRTFKGYVENDLCINLNKYSRTSDTNLKVEKCEIVFPEGYTTIFND